MTAAVLMCLVTGMTQASAEAADPNVGALARIADGTYTQADLDLIRSQPELAGQVADPTAAGETTETATSAGKLATSQQLIDLDSSAVTTYCGAWARVSVSKYSLTGSLIFRWTHHVEYCRDGYRVLKFTSRYDYMSYASSVVQVGGLTANAYGGVGSSTAWSHRQRHLTYCVLKYGCYANVYPWSKIWVRGNGSYTYTRGS